MNGRLCLARAAILGTLTLAACAPAAPQVDLAAEEAAIRAVADSVTAAESAKDAQTAITFYADDAVVHPQDAPAVQGRDGMLALYGQFFTPEMTAFSATTTAVHVAASGDMAWVTGTNTITMTGPSGAMNIPGKFLVVAKKVNGAWRVAALSFNNDAPMTMPPAMTTTHE
jgi:uncharacterized protein (TIGR02246 family)